MFDNVGGRMSEEPARLPDGGFVLPWLTDKQYEFLRYIYLYTLEHRDYPTVNELAERFHLTKGGVGSVVTSLIKKQYLFRDRAFAQRNLRMTQVAFEKMARDTEIEATAQKGLFGEN